MRSGARPPWWQGTFWVALYGDLSAGLSWETVLNKRQAFRESFSWLSPSKCRGDDGWGTGALMDNPAIIEIVLRSCDTGQCSSLSTSPGGIWIVWCLSLVFCRWENHRQWCSRLRQAPAKTALSEKLAKDLKKRGFKFTGPVAVLSYLQAIGIVDDHENDCEWKSGNKWR